MSIANIKRLSDIRIGDTITQVPRSAEVALPGYQEPVPVVFCGLFPATNNQFDDLRTALQKLALNDSSFTFEPESSDALGFGFRCGFLGMLHMEIVQQRLERESNLSLVQTAPTVTYEILGRDGEDLAHLEPDARFPTPARSRSFASRSPASTSSSPAIRSARSCSFAKTGAAFTRRPSTSRRRGRSSLTSCRSPR